MILIYVTIDNNRVSTDTLAEKALELELLGPLFVLETVCFCVAARTHARLACFSGRVRKVIFLSNPGATRGGEVTAITKDADARGQSQTMLPRIGEAIVRRCLFSIIIMPSSFCVP